MERANEGRISIPSLRLHNCHPAAIMMQIRDINPTKSLSPNCSIAADAGACALLAIIVCPPAYNSSLLLKKELL